MKKYRITQVRSRIGRPAVQKRTLDALGVRRMNRPILVKGSPEIEGMIRKVRHLLTVEEVQE